MAAEDRRIRGDVALVGEVERRFDERARFDQSGPPALDLGAEHALRLGDRLPPLRLGLGGDEVGEALQRREVHPAGLEGAPRELARAGEPHSRHGP